LRYVLGEHKTAELCLAAVKKNGRSLEYVPMEHMSVELCAQAVRSYGAAFRYVPLNLQAEVEAAL